MLQFFELLARLRQKQPGLVEQFLSTHPPAAQRANHVRALLTRLRGGTEDTASFHAVRDRIVRLAPPPRRR